MVYVRIQKETDDTDPRLQKQPEISVFDIGLCAMGISLSIEKSKVIHKRHGETDDARTALGLYFNLIVETD